MVTIASWLVTVEPAQSGQVRRALESRPGVECHSELHGSLVIVTESETQDPDLVDVRQCLSSVPGVRDADLVATCEDGGDLRVVRLGRRC